MKVREVMNNRVARVRARADLYQAAEAVSLANVSDLMVVDERGDFIGVLPAGDILRACLPKVEDIIAEGGSIQQAFSLFLKTGRELSRMPIMPLVIREPLSLDPDDHVAKVAATLVQTNIHMLPVVKDRKLLGVVTRVAILEKVVGLLHSAVDEVQEP